MTLRRTSKTRIARNRRLKAEYADSTGLPFSEYRLWLPERVSEWRSVRPVDDPQVPRDFHDWWCTCWNCEEPPGYTTPVDFHHIMGGTKGRSDEYANGCMLCRKCHANANTAKLPMGRILALKHKRDRAHTNWVRLALLHRSHLPPLILDNGETHE